MKNLSGLSKLKFNMFISCETDYSQNEMKGSAFLFEFVCLRIFKKNIIPLSIDYKNKARTNVFDFVSVLYLIII